MFMVLSSSWAIARVHPVHLISSDSTPGRRQPSNQAVDLACESAAIHIHHWHLLLLLGQKADTPFTVTQTVEDLVDLGTAVRVCSPCSRLYYFTVAAVINTTARCEIQTRDISAQSGMLPLHRPALSNVSAVKLSTASKINVPKHNILKLVHGQVTIIFVVSVCLFVQSFSQPSLIRFRSN